MYQDEVMVPVGDWAKTRLKNLSDTDKRRDESKVGSGFGKNISNWIDRDMVYPSNVLHMATECYNQQHSAVFPVDLPAWFIKLFTQPGDLVLDTFQRFWNNLCCRDPVDRRFLELMLTRIIVKSP
jgi:site-specific DNA-methyltransferase (adenine-specific)/site-specific DNA-methyltransferase (cytosine-N4-specific)